MRMVNVFVVSKCYRGIVTLLHISWLILAQVLQLRVSETTILNSDHYRHQRTVQTILKFRPFSELLPILLHCTEFKFTHAVWTARKPPHSLFGHTKRIRINSNAMQFYHISIRTQPTIENQRSISKFRTLIFSTWATEHDCICFQRSPIWNGDRPISGDSEFKPWLAGGTLSPRGVPFPAARNRMNITNVILTAMQFHARYVGRNALFPPI